MRLAIVGSVSLEGSKEAAQIIEDVLDKYKPTVVVSGGAKGIDTMATDAAKRRHIGTTIFHPKVQGWRDGYRPRNLQIARGCDVLVRIVATGSRTYGSGWTRDRAIELGKHTEEYVIE